MAKERVHIVRMRDNSNRKILTQLAEDLNGLRFNDLQAKTSLSSETLAERLDELASKGFVEKTGGRYGAYHITSKGSDELNRLESLPTRWAKEIKAELVPIRGSDRFPSVMYSGSFSIHGLRRMLHEDERDRLVDPVSETANGYTITIPQEIFKKSRGGRIVLGWRRTK